MVFDGAGVAAGQAAGDHAHQTASHAAHAPDAHAPAATGGGTMAADPSASGGRQLTPENPSRKAAEIVFIDGSLPDIPTLLQSVDPNAKVVLLDPARDGVDQIAATLAHESGVSAVHILSHGTEGNLQIGTADLNARSMSTAYAGDLATIGAALTADADVLLYGCDFAKGDSGMAAMNALAAATGADIAASSDTTGAASLGGDWVLEAETGQIETDAAISLAAQQDWQHTLTITASGSETLVNEITTGIQQTATTSGKQIAADANGNYVAVWEDLSSGVSEVYARKYAADGTPATAAFQVSTTNTNAHDTPSVAMDANGNFVVAWRAANEDGGGYGIYAQRYDASATAQGSTFLVNTNTALDQTSPAIAMNASGFVVAWSSFGQDGDGYGIYGQRYDASGVAQGSEFLVNTYTALDQTESAVAMNAAGDFIVTWTSHMQDTSAEGVFGQRFDASGVAQGAEFQVNTYTSAAQRYSDVAISTAGDFVVTWTSWAQDGGNWGVYAQRFDSSGVAQGAEFLVPTTTAEDQAYGTVAMDPGSGRFVISWMSWLQDKPGDGFHGQYAKAFNADGSADGNEFLVNTTTIYSQRNGDVAWGGGQIVALWSGNGTGDGDGVFVQRYIANNAPTITSGGTANVPENSTAVMTVTGNDVDGDPLTYAIAGGADAAKFTIDANSGALAFAAAPDFETPTDAGADNVYDVIVQVSDGALTANKAVAVTVTGVNEAPAVTSAATADVAENATAVMTVTGSDPDAGATLTYAIAGGADAAKFTIDANSGALAFAAAPNFEAPADNGGDNVYDVIVEVSDGSLTGTKAVAVTVTNVNEGPTVTSPATATVLEYALPVMTVTASDPDAGTTFTYSIAGGADGGKFAINAATGALQFLAGPDYEFPGDANSDNVYEVTVQASDGALAATKDIAVTVSNVAPPYFTSGPTATISENSATAATVIAHDPDGHALTYGITGGADAAKFAIDGGSGVLSFVSAPDYENPTNVDGNNVYQVIVCATEGIVTIEQSVAVTVTNVNEAPSVTSGDTASVAENGTAVAAITGSDPDAGAVLTYAIAGGADAAKFTIDANTGALAFVMAPDFDNPADAGGDNVYDVNVQVSDGSLTAAKAVAVTVTGVNEAPSVTSSGAASVAENGAAVMTVIGSDPDAGTVLTFTIAGGADAAKFTIDANSGTLSFVAAPDFEIPADANSDNVYDVIVEVSDGALTATKAVAVTVTDVNETPGAPPPDPGPGPGQAPITAGASDSPAPSHFPSRPPVSSEPLWVFPANDTVFSEADGGWDLFPTAGLADSTERDPFFDATPQPPLQPVAAPADAGGTHNSASTRELGVDTELSGRHLIMQLHGDKAHVTAHSEFSVLQADGRPLPRWVSVLPNGCVVADVPEGTDRVALKIVIHSDGQPDREARVTVSLPDGNIAIASGDVQPSHKGLKFLDQLKRSRLEPGFLLP